MRIKTYQVGQIPKLSVAIKVSGTLTDPDELTFTMIEPDHSETEYVYGTDAELVRSGTGEFYVKWLIDQEGIHRYRFHNPSGLDGTASGAAEWEFVAARTRFAP